MQLPIQLKDNVIPRNVYLEYNLRLVALNRNKLLWGAAAALLFIALILNIYEFIQHVKPFPWLLCVLSAGYAFAYFGIPARLRAHFGKVYDKTPAIGATSDFLFTPDYLEANSEASHGEMKWSAVVGAVPHGDWLMLHLHNRTFFVLDTRKFVLPATVNDLTVLLEQQNIPFGIEKVASILRMSK